MALWVKRVTNKSFDKNKVAKRIILTIDYELFLGKDTAVNESMMGQLQIIFTERNGSRMTIFGIFTLL
jgi:hypothetical protein